MALLTKEPHCIATVIPVTWEQLITVIIFTSVSITVFRAFLHCYLIRRQCRHLHFKITFVDLIITFSLTPAGADGGTCGAIPCSLGRATQSKKCHLAYTWHFSLSCWVNSSWDWKGKSQVVLVLFLCFLILYLSSVMGGGGEQCCLGECLKLYPILFSLKLGFQSPFLLSFFPLFFTDSKL